MNRFLITLSGLLLCTTLIQAQPATMSYQGFLELAGVPVDSPQNLTFSLHTALVGGTPVWTETQNAVPVSGGIYHVELGSVTTLEGIDFNQALWLEVEVGGTPLTPRTQLQGVPYAHTLQVPATLSGSTITVLGSINTSPTGGTFGIWGQSTSTAGTGVFGRASATTGFSYGVRGESFSSDGRGVYGQATALTGETYGVWGRSLSTNGRGVYGQAATATGLSHGVHGESSSTSGRGVYGRASATTGFSRGVHGESSSTNGTGVFGQATAGTGNTTYGVFGVVTSADGYAGYFTNGNGVYARGHDNNKADLILGGHGSSHSNDDGRIFSDPAYASSDIWLHSNDAVVVKLNSDGNSENADFIIMDKDNTTIFNVNQDGTVTMTNDVIVGGTTVHTSDRNRKEAFEAVDVAALLEEVARLPVQRWQYKGQTIRHLGPTAQDFYAAFGIGHNETTIASVDADGVALAAIQGLYHENRQLRSTLEDLIKRIEGLERESECKADDSQ